MTYKISERDARRITLNESDTAASIRQNIAMILATRQQSVPLYRDFGLPTEFVGKPVTVAKPLIIAEIREAIMKYEPRAELVGVTLETDENDPGKLIQTVEVSILEQ